MFCTSIKFILISLVSLYVSYLYIYKCENVSTLDTLLHPINSHHKTMCDYVYKTETFAKPHLENAQSLWVKNVHSTDLFKKYQIHEKAGKYSSIAYEYIHPVLIEVFKVIEIVEVYAYDYSILGFNKAKNFYETTVLPKYKELTN